MYGERHPEVSFTDGAGVSTLCFVCQFATTTKKDREMGSYIYCLYSQLFPQQPGSRGSWVSLLCSSLATKSHFSQVRSFFTTTSATFTYSCLKVTIWQVSAWIFLQYCFQRDFFGWEAVRGLAANYNHSVLKVSNTYFVTCLEHFHLHWFKRSELIINENSKL